ncbi:MAG: phage/plasmid replication protein [Pyrinomonadaceae bacterium]
MIDTVELKHCYRSLKCNDFQNDWQHINRYGNPRWVLNPQKPEKLPHLTMIFTPNGLWHLYARVSIPNLLFGHNSRLPNQSEVLNGLDLLGKFVESKSGNSFDPQSATVSAVDFVYDVPLGKETTVHRTVKHLSKRRLNRFWKCFIEELTLYFNSKGKRRTRQIRIYPKLPEVLSRKSSNEEAIQFARGVLRIENCFRHKRSIDSFVKEYSLEDSSANSILKEKVAKQSISRILKKLNFNDAVCPTKDSTLNILLRKFKPLKAMKLLGFLRFVNERGLYFYKDEALGFSKDSYYRCIRDCSDAGVW